MVGNDTFVGLHQDTVDFFFSQGNIIIDDLGCILVHI